VQVTAGRITALSAWPVPEGGDPLAVAVERVQLVLLVPRLLVERVA
jgi:hypothetical protein